MSDSATLIQDRDYTGRRFGFLTAVMRKDDDPKKWLCRCECGRETVASIYNLLSGNTKRCGHHDCVTKTKNITGQRFGNLVAVDFVGFHRLYADGRSMAVWQCRCDCGNETEVPYSNLVSGHTQSCGCLLSKATIARFTKHGLSHSRLKRIRDHMLERCYAQDDPSYHRYGARGIRVCDEWLQSLESFARWSIDHGYNDTLTLDRIDNSGGYTPDNCRWVTYAEQNRNTSRNHWFDVHGEAMVLADVASKFGVSPSAIYYHLNQGKTEAEIIEYYESRRCNE